RNIYLSVICLQKILFGVFLDQDLLHRLLKLLFPRSMHASGKIQAVEIQRRFLKLCLIQIQSVHEDIRLGHSDRREDLFCVDSPFFPKDFSIFLRYAVCGNTPSCRLYLCLAFASEKMLLKFKKSLLFFTVSVVYISKGRISHRQTVVRIDHLKRLFSLRSELFIRVNDQ